MRPTQVLKRESDSRWGFYQEFPGCIAVGKTKAELVQNLRDALAGTESR